MPNPSHIPLKAVRARALQRLRQPLVGHTAEGDADPSRILQYISDHRRELMPFGAAAVTGTAASLLSKKGNRWNNFAKGGVGGYIAARLLQGAGDLLEAEARQARAVDIVNKRAREIFEEGTPEGSGPRWRLPQPEMNEIWADPNTQRARDAVNAFDLNEYVDRP